MNGNKKEQKRATFFYCKKCDFSTSKKGNWDRHISTLKHKMITNDNQKRALFSLLHECSNCGKKYKFKSGLSRHHVVCDIKTTNKKMDELLKKVDELNKKEPTVINNYTLKVYLDKTYSDAISLDEFVKNLHISMADMRETHQQGVVKGISNLIIKNLTSLEKNIRPIHCSDVSNFYVKTSEEWENDNGTRVSTAVDKVQTENIKYIIDNMKSQKLNDNDFSIELIKILSEKNKLDKDMILKNIANSVKLHIVE